MVGPVPTPGGLVVKYGSKIWPRAAGGMPQPSSITSSLIRSSLATTRSVVTDYGHYSQFPRFQKSRVVAKKDGKTCEKCNPKKEEKRPWTMDSGNWAIPGMRLVDKSGMPIDSFPQLQASASVNLSATRKILDGGKFSADVVFDQLKNGKLQAFDLPGMLTMSGTFILRESGDDDIRPEFPDYPDCIAQDLLLIPDAESFIRIF